MIIKGTLKVALEYQCSDCGKIKTGEAFTVKFF